MQNSTSLKIGDLFECEKGSNEIFLYLGFEEDKNFSYCGKYAHFYLCPDGTVRQVDIFSNNLSDVITIWKLT